MILEYNTILGETESTTVIEHSKFICNLKRIENEEDAKEFISIIKKRHSLANHHCYAYIADENGLNMKFSDDGEPQGTAGMPMLDVLKSKKVYKTCAVVTRYFGGIKLGTGGLVRAYSGSVVQALNESDLRVEKYALILSVKSDYENYKFLNKFLQNADVFIIDTEFADEINVKLALKYTDESSYKMFIDKLSDIFRGKPRIEELSREYFPFRV